MSIPHSVVRGDDEAFLLERIADNVDERYKGQYNVYLFYEEKLMEIMQVRNLVVGRRQNILTHIPREFYAVVIDSLRQVREPLGELNCGWMLPSTLIFQDW